MINQYNRINNVLGWVVFAIAAFTYCSTIEPTASFWDCPEFITTAFKMEVGHPPGAPFFMLMGNIFTQFVSDTSKVAMMVNMMSALMSAACILFLFWSITHLTRKLICHKGIVETSAQLITIMGAGVVGALAYTFSDTFWFSAVEGEVYAFSSLFTAVVFWLILKWEDNADKPHSDRYLVLIAYLMGLSIGVHLLNLLCIPAILLVYYYRKSGDKSNLKGSLLVLILSFVVLAAILYGIVPGIVKIAGWFELLFVNTLGMSFNTGEIIYVVLLFITIIWAIYESYVSTNRKRMNISFLLSVAMLGIPFYGFGVGCVLLGIIVLGVLAFLLMKNTKIQKTAELPRILNTTLLCFLMLMIGYSTYAVIVIRSTANPPMDQNSPEDVFTLGEYLNRDQYGSTPLLYGPAYTSQVKTVREGDYLVPVRSKGAPIFQRVEKHSADEPDKYEQIGNKGDYEYAQNMLFPRIWDEHHAQEYEGWLGGVEGKQVEWDRGDGKVQYIKMPTQLDNLRFFLSYQLNFMYWRYFMWNFAGRQNDIQGLGECEHGNWISGIPFLDNLRLGDQSKLPDLLKNNKGCNKFYMLPLILGLLGLFWQAYRGKKGIRQFWIVFFLFFMTGIAIVLYLNQTPNQPRERDYAYAGSFYAFAIWIGLGVAAIIEWLKNLKLGESAKAAIVSAACLLVPIQMATQTWDDHDRSGRYTCRDFGQNYLNSIQAKGNPIIFTNGDNDTFPLWYAQETEGQRRDARVCNLSYLQTDWYIDQMRRPAYESPAVPITWNRYEFVTGQNEAVPIHPEMKKQLEALYREKPQEARQAFGENPFELKNILKYWVRSSSDDMHVIPTDSIVMTIDKDAVRRSGMKLVDDSIPDYLHISLKGKNALYKNSLMMLEMLAETNWERPLYFAITVGRDNYLSFSENFLQEGLAFRITPFETAHLGKTMDVETMYDNLMHKFKLGGIDRPGIYLDETTIRMCYTHRRMYSMLAQALLEQGDKKRALEVVNYADRMIPDANVPYADNLGGSIEIATTMIECGEKKKGEEILRKLAESSKQYLDWYLSFSREHATANQRSCREHFYDFYQAVMELQKAKVKDGDKLFETVEMYFSELMNKGVNIGFGK